MNKSLFLLLAWMALLQMPVSAQNTDPFGEESSNQSEKRSLSIQFPGGSLAELLEQVRHDSPEPLNIVDQGGAHEIPVPQLKLEAVSAEDLMEILNFMGSSGSADVRFTLNRVTDNTWVVGKPAARSFLTLAQSAPPIETPATPSAAVATEPPTAPILPHPGAGVAGAMPIPGRASAGGIAAYGSASTTEVPEEAAFLPVSRLLKDHTVEDILTTVSTAWDMLKLSGQASEHIRFHEDTKLLIVTGDPATLSLVKSALSALEADANTEREQALMKQVEDAQMLARQLEMRNEQSKEQIRMSEQMAAQQIDSVKQSLEIDLKRLAEENAELRARLREMESERQQH